MMRGFLIAVLIGLLAGVLQAQDGVRAEVIPSQVQPGDLFELKVSMERPEYAKFELQVPGHDHLHRVDVESIPVRLEDGFYRQQETWLLQADSSGEFLIEGATLVLDTGKGVEELTLPAMKVEVLPYSEIDKTSEPLELPEAAAENAADTSIGWIVGGVLLALGCWWWMLKSNRTGVVDQVAEKSEVDLALDRLAKGQLDQKDLEQLMVGRKWSDEAGEALAEVVYGGASDHGRLVAILRKEAGK
ncbi:hypothetical protein [Haloferula sp.]|uniref:hypothetical protein n=1 Tax=Haloferula sp. TaxID=2497595 RepID=UPI0032A11D5E